MSKETPQFDDVFSCRCCGECCRGAGGIVLREKDTGRLAGHFGMPVESFLATYAERVRGKFRLRAAPDGACVFFEPDGRCGVHAAKPDVCRAWPFFRGNLVDPVSLAMAGEGCPGIPKNAAHAAFSEHGARYLLERQIFVTDTETCRPSALLTERALRHLANHGHKTPEPATRGREA